MSDDDLLTVVTSPTNSIIRSKLRLTSHAKLDIRTITREDSPAVLESRFGAQLEGMCAGGIRELSRRSLPFVTLHTSQCYNLQFD